eukprot:TRINITY_DN15432_c0_g1_i1.p1 TRINITY_DN15432_c0_g1~~TRINITY_DN15432_c0_g1_i1.p1  ORF type:complete len:227 (+),score=28.93 TRINITY_DN15432_c0_g1_i1:395-1075(+)
MTPSGEYDQIFRNPDALKVYVAGLYGSTSTFSWNSIEFKLMLGFLLTVSVGLLLFSFLRTALRMLIAPDFSRLEIWQRALIYLDGVLMNMLTLGLVLPLHVMKFGDCIEAVGPLTAVESSGVYLAFISFFFFALADFCRSLLKSETPGADSPGGRHVWLCGPCFLFIGILFLVALGVIAFLSTTAELVLGYSAMLGAEFFSLIAAAFVAIPEASRAVNDASWLLSA